MKRTRRDIDKYLDSLPEEVQADMKTLDRTLSKVMKGGVRELYEGKFWGGSDQEIVGYGRTSSTRSDGRTIEYFLIGLALQKNYISIYISAVEGREYLSEKYGHTVASPDGKVKVGKSSISFKSLADIDLEQLSALAQRARAIGNA